MNRENNKISLNVSSPTLTTDGHMISFNKNGEITIMFFQILPNGDPQIMPVANTVANVRLNLDQAKKLSESLAEAIQKYEEKSQK